MLAHQVQGIVGFSSVQLCVPWRLHRWRALAELAGHERTLLTQSLNSSGVQDTHEEIYTKSITPLDIRYGHEDWAGLNAYIWLVDCRSLVPQVGL